MNIKDVAKRANVSISTVSRVINNTAKVNADTRARVEKVLKETNYRPNALARELQQKKTNTIGVIMSAKDLEISSVGATLNAISDVLRENGYNMMLANSRFITEYEYDFFRIFQEKRVDGVIYFANEFTDEHYELLDNFPAPIVLLGQEYKRLDIPCAIHDDFHAAREATMYLINKGHERIGYIGCPSSDIATGVKRRRGFEMALESVNLSIKQSFVKEGDFTIESGYQKMLELINERESMPTAVFIGTDYMAIGAIKALKDNGLSVPEDISIIGFDDVHVSAYVNPPLTTVATDKIGVGKLAATHLLKCIEKKEIEMARFVADYQLIERESVLDISKPLDLEEKL